MKKVFAALATVLTLTGAIWLRADRADTARRQFANSVNGAVIGEPQSYFGAAGNVFVVTPIQADMSKVEVDSAMAQLFDGEPQHARAISVLKSKGFKKIEIVTANATSIRSIQ